MWAFGPNIVKGYWNRPEATAEAFHDGWLKTGDIAMLDSEGFCTILDRAQDMLIRGGENIYCAEVENVLTQHPHVADAALVGLPHPVAGRSAGCAGAGACGHDRQRGELAGIRRERLAPFKVPVKVHVSHAALPRNDGGKLVKHALRKVFGP